MSQPRQLFLQINAQLVNINQEVTKLIQYLDENNQQQHVRTVRTLYDYCKKLETSLKDSQDGYNAQIKDLNNRIMELVRNEGSLQERIRDLEEINKTLESRIGELENQLRDSESKVLLGEILYSLEWHLTNKYMGQDARMTVGDLDSNMDGEDKKMIVQLMNQITWSPFISRQTHIHFGQLRAAINSMKEVRFNVSHLSKEQRDKYSSLPVDDLIKRVVGDGQWSEAQEKQIAQITKLLYLVQDNRPLFEPVVSLSNKSSIYDRSFSEL